MLCLLLAVSASVHSANVVINAPVANMYSRASANAGVVSQAIYGANAGVVARRAGWLRIRTADRYSGWIVASQALRHAPYAQTGRFVQIESLFANLYREADITKHRPLLTLPYEARLEVLVDRPDDPRWLQVRLASGRKAWVQRGDVSSDLKPRSLAEVLQFGRRFLGLPYLWGGTSTYGYDCSGFTQMLLRRRGVVLPRDAGQQAEWPGAVAAPKDKLQPGDLLYFGDSPDKIAHTGMYLGNGEFIDATPWQHPVVQIDRLDDAHWAPLFVAARRIP